MRKATGAVRLSWTTQEISIPAFREEGDAMSEVETHLIGISIPAFREEGDVLLAEARSLLPEFQSPPSVRKATDLPRLSIRGGKDFNPRLP